MFSFFNLGIPVHVIEDLPVSANISDVIVEGWSKDFYVFTSDGWKPLRDVDDAVAENTIAFAFFRVERNKMLADSDWTQMPDVQVDKDAWAEYRQALRDLPANTIDPENPVWPTPPNN